MYAVIKASGRQYRIEPGMVLELNRVPGSPGDTLTLDENVLMVSTDAGVQVGTPLIEGASVDLEIMEHFRGKKVIVFKMKRRKRCRCKQGHRQELTRVTVRDIKLN